MDTKERTHLLNIKIVNFRSFCEEQTISFSDDNISMRKITSIVGLNATGKSNIALAMQKFKRMVKDSANADFALPYQPFLFKAGMNDKPSTFSLEFRTGEFIYTYTVSFNSSIILSETLKERPKNSLRKRMIFTRTLDNINAGATNFGFGKGIALKTRDNSLLITKAFENNNKYALKVFSALNSFYVLRCNDGRLEQKATTLLHNDPSLRDRALKALRLADLSIDDLRVDEIKISEEIMAKINAPDFIKDELRTRPATILNAGHIVKDKNGQPITDNKGHKFVISNGFNNESMGTRAFIGIIVPIIDSIDKGKVLYIDEFGAYLHYSLVEMIINSYKNAKNAPGLIINTHAGTTLNCLDRDSIIFTSKEKTFNSTIISTAKEKHIRNDDNFSKGFYSEKYIKFDKSNILF